MDLAKIQVSRLPDLSTNGKRAAMADTSASDSITSPALEPSQGLPARPGVREPSSTAEPLALAAVSGNAAAGLSIAPQDARPPDSKPVFMMKRTGHATLPQATDTPVRDRDRSWSGTPTPASSHGQGPSPTDPEPAQVVSDILPPPQPLCTPIQTTFAAQPTSTSASNNGRKTKYTTDEERRKATSLALKRTRTPIPSPLIAKSALRVDTYLFASIQSDGPLASWTIP